MTVHILAASINIAKHAASMLQLEERPKVYTKEEELRGVSMREGDFWIYAHAKRLPVPMQSKMYDCKVQLALSQVPVLELTLP